ncbi:MAG TPA: transporter, partial [Cupriavidus sp.]|nr:transporter [Cupriavidus sp.]
MRIHLLVAAPVMLLCLILQGVVVAICLRRYARYRKRWEGREALWMEIALLMAVMLLTLACNI